MNLGDGGIGVVARRTERPPNHDLLRVYGRLLVAGPANPRTLADELGWTRQRVVACLDHLQFAKRREIALQDDGTYRVRPEAELGNVAMPALREKLPAGTLPLPPAPPVADDEPKRTRRAAGRPRTGIRKENDHETRTGKPQILQTPIEVNASESDRIRAALNAAGLTGLSRRDLERRTGIRYEVLGIRLPEMADAGVVRHNGRPKRHSRWLIAESAER